MPTTTISLERSAYELLKARKRPDESFSEELHRLLGHPEPVLKEFLDIVPADVGGRVADAIEALRAEDLAVEKRRRLRKGGIRGHRA